MKILQINVVANYGSTGKIVEDIGDVVVSQGWESFIAYGRAKSKVSKSKLIKIGSQFDFLFHGIYTRLTDRHGFASVEATKIFVKQIEKIKPNIVHLHNLHGYYINIEILFNYLKKTNIPIVWTLHDCWAFTGHCAYFDFIGCEKWKTKCHKCPQIRHYPSSLILDNSKNNYEDKKVLFNGFENMVLVPVSKWLNKLLPLSILGNVKSNTIYNGINLSVFYPKKTFNIKKKYGLEDKFVIIGVANIWDKRKGLVDFIELSKLIGPNELLVLVGLSEKQIKKIPKKIISIQRTEDMHELADLYSAADVFINLTYDEAFGLTNIEALACGTPVITYRTGGSVETVSKETGFTVDKGSLEDVLEKIKSIKLKGKKKYSLDCVKRAHNNFKKEDQYLKYIDLYKNILNQ